MATSSFKSWLLLQKRAQNTVESYIYAVEQFKKLYGRVTHEKLQQYKLYLIENYKPKSVNIRLCGINAYLEYLGKKEWQLPHVKLQQKPFLENVISQPDYEYLRDSLLKSGRKKWYFIVRFLAATGARISELLKMKVEHVRIGYLDINSKGGKTRRIYIPESLRKSALAWLAEEKRESGFLFLNRSGKVMTAAGLGGKLKRLGVEFGLESQVVYPHSFRHRFAKNFIEKYNDIALLADLMGHSNIETTRIYLRRTHAEQRQIVDTIITW